MVERGRARAGSAAWPAAIAAAGRRVLRAPRLHAAAAAAAQRLRIWASAEIAPGRLVPWLAVAFGSGVALYFAAEREPELWAALLATAVLAAAAYRCRNRPVAFPLLLGLGMVAAGFAAATLRAVMVGQPVLAQPVWNAVVAGWVEAREQRETSDRIIVRVHQIVVPGRMEQPARVRVAVRKGTAPPVGSFVRFRARLLPPLAPLRPGGYDFARELFFKGIGASGFVLGRIEPAPAPGAHGVGLRGRAALSVLREVIDARIRRVLPDDRGSIASALITGKRDAISAAVNEAMYVSSLGHVLSISGYHMAVVAGVVFFAVRGLLALVPAAALLLPIKKLAAVVALAAAAFYLLLSGAAVATQRAFIMVAIVLVGVLLDRQALTLRTLTIAALVVLTLSPEMLVTPSFQMSFAATLALIAAYQQSRAFRPSADTGVGARMALWGVNAMVGLLVASLAAGTATMLYAAFHFHRLAPYGVVANLLAMPIVSGLVMPFGLLGVIALPFGFDAPLWRVMGLGIAWMIGVARWVAALPGAAGRIAAFGTGPLLLGTAGLLVICLLRTPLRLAGLGLAAATVLWAAATPLPAILVAADGQTVALRGANGRLAFLGTGRDRFARLAFLAADGDGGTPAAADAAAAIRCDPDGCLGRLGDGRIVALARTAEAVAEDCRHAAVVITPRLAPPNCAALAIDRDTLCRSGAVALFADAQGFALVPTRPAGYDRPWAPARIYDLSGTPAVSAGPERSPMPRDDATPAPDSLEPEDGG